MSTDKFQPRDRLSARTEVLTFSRSGNHNEKRQGQAIALVVSSQWIAICLIGTFHETSRQILWANSHPFKGTEGVRWFSLLVENYQLVKHLDQLWSV